MIFNTAEEFEIIEDKNIDLITKIARLSTCLIKQQLHTISGRHGAALQVCDMLAIKDDKGEINRNVIIGGY